MSNFLKHHCNYYILKYLFGNNSEHFFLLHGLCCISFYKKCRTVAVLSTRFGQILYWWGFANVVLQVNSYCKNTVYHQKAFLLAQLHLLTRLYLQRHQQIQIGMRWLSLHYTDVALPHQAWVPAENWLWSGSSGVQDGACEDHAPALLHSAHPWFHLKVTWICPWPAVGQDPAALGRAAVAECHPRGRPHQCMPTIPHREVGIGKCVSFILTKTGKFLSVVTAEQLRGCVDKTAFWEELPLLKHLRAQW